MPILLRTTHSHFAPPAASTLRLGLVLLALPLVGCQAAAGAVGAAGAAETSPARLSIDSAAVSTPGVPARGSSNLTYTVHRGTIQDTLSIPGRVAPALSAQITLQSPGTISAIHVRSGQPVKQGDPLVEVAVDESALEAARTRATLADLEYESQQARVDAMKRGTAPDELAVARAGVARAQAEVHKAQVQRDAAALPDPDKAAAATAATDTAAKQVALAELAVKNAEAELVDAQAGVKRVKTLIEQAKSDSEAAAKTDAETADARVQTASAAARLAAEATRTAQRKTDEAAARLEEAQASPNLTRVQQDLATEQNQVLLAKEALHDAQAAADGLDGSKDPTGVIAAAATTEVRTAGRTLGHELDHLQLIQATLDPARQADARAVRLAQLAIDQAKDDLAQAQAGEAQAGQDLQRAKDGATPLPRLSIAEVQLDLTAAEARVSAAGRNIQVENLRLEQARAVAQPPDTSAQDALKRQTAEADIAVAQAGLDEAQSRLAALQQGTAADDIAREDRRAALLQESANVAHQSIQSTFVAVAPFDGTVASVSVGMGQLVESRTIAAQVAGIGSLSVKASATESDVTGLALNQKLSVTFPSLGDGVTADGMVVDISGAAATSGTSGTDKVTYPVTVELGSVPDALKLGMSAMLTVNLRTAQDVLYVPTNAIRKVDNQTLATTVGANGQLADTPIRTGAAFGANVEVLSGLNDGDVVTVFSSTVASIKQP